MRASRILRVLRRGDAVLCAKLNLFDPRIVEIAGLAGFDAIWVCMEHVPYTLAQVENQVRAAKIYDMDVIVRVPRGSYSDLIRPLEMDAAGLMVPHVLDEQDACCIVQQTRFHPVGLRAFDGAGADGDYGNVSLDAYMQHANTQRLVIAQIEDPSAFSQIEQIASVPGIDMLFFGPADYSQALGIPGKFDDPRITAAQCRVAEVARNHGLFAGIPAYPEDVPALMELGYRFFNIASDVRSLSSYFRQSVRTARERMGEATTSRPSSDERPGSPVVGQCE